MKQLFFLGLILMILSGCSHKIVRIGYEADKARADENCTVIIKNDSSLNQVPGVKAGEIKLGDTGFSSSCDEDDAIRILKEEACGLESNLIVITSERRPGLVSTCFRCTADFYQIPETAAVDLQTDPAYSSEAIQNRVKKDATKKVLMTAGSFAVGFAIGFLLFI